MAELDERLAGVEVEHEVGELVGGDVDADVHLQAALRSARRRQRGLAAAARHDRVRQRIAARRWPRARGASACSGRPAAASGRGRRARRWSATAGRRAAPERARPRTSRLRCRRRWRSCGRAPSAPSRRRGAFGEHSERTVGLSDRGRPRRSRGRGPGNNLQYCARMQAILAVTVPVLRAGAARLARRARGTAAGERDPGAERLRAVLRPAVHAVPLRRRACRSRGWPTRRCSRVYLVCGAADRRPDDRRHAARAPAAHGVDLRDAAFGALVAAFPNAGFMGVPLLVALLGDAAAGPVIGAILVDLVVTSTLCLAHRAGAARTLAPATTSARAARPRRSRCAAR